MRRRLAAASLVLLFNFIVAQAAPAYAEAAPQAGGFRLYLPVVAHGSTPAGPAEPAFPSLDTFAAAVAGGAAETVRGVYVPGVLALPVVQQPQDNAAYVAPQTGVATQFRLAAFYGVTGLLAHNYASGDLFFDLRMGQSVAVIHGDGSTKDYVVSEIRRYQALQPYSTVSEFVDLETGQTLSAADVFMRVYTGGDRVTFQTCIAQNGNGSWGRLFVIALPLQTDAE